MMRPALLLFFFAVCVFCVFGDTGEQEEIDFLLFAPNSSNEFVNKDQAMKQLDTMAGYLKSKNLNPDQIQVCGYAAAAVNDIDSTVLSRERALFVIHELRARGVPGALFSDPVGYGEVDTWGSNDDERSLNRRVRIMLDGAVLTPAVVKAAEPKVVPAVDREEKPAVQEKPADTGSPFSWKWLLPLLLVLLAAIIFLLLKKRKRPAEDDKPVRNEVPAAAPVAAPVPVRETVVNLEEEIRFRAYEHYQWRNGQSENADEDWHEAVPEVCARYEADGYRTYWEDGSWWARKSS